MDFRGTASSFDGRSICTDNDTSIEAGVTHSESPSPMLGGSPLHPSKLKGAWTKPLFIAEDTPQGPPMALEFSRKDNSEWPALSSRLNGKTRVEAAQSTRIKTHLQVARMNPQSRNLHRVTVPEYMEDDTSKVTIPDHVLLHGLQNQKEYVIGQFTRCLIPSGGLVYAVLNRLWDTTDKLGATLPSDTHAYSSPQQKSTRGNPTKSTTTQNTEYDVNQQTSVPPVHTLTSLPPTVFESSSIEELNVSRVLESDIPIVVEELLSLTNISVLENMYMSPTIVCINEETDSPPLDYAPSLQNMDSTPQETSRSCNDHFTL
ncbi:hypothetical protein F2Q69_00013933 [Brassica cretica]|uniref:Uncharacterized protein n=1 Tax=Brassica cretica TaxID=69181 RepID=A0A8S9QWR5_BRACR|nr:hypothetical protein F2Q69_00013933 [Brassica cretica]